MASERIWLGNGDSINAATSDPLFTFDTVKKTATRGIIYLPAFYERGSAPSGTGNFTIGGYSASDNNNGYFCMHNPGQIVGAGLTIQTTGVSNGDECILVVANATAATSQNHTATLTTGLVQMFSFDFPAPLSFSAGDQLLPTWQLNLTGSPTYLSMTVMYEIVLTG